MSIYWTFEDINESGELKRYQDEVDGLIIFGYWNNSLPEKLTDLDVLSSFWINASVDLKSRKWKSEDYNCFSVEIYIKKWPMSKDWDEIIKRSLMWLIQQGAVLAWCGGEDSSPSIEVFNPKHAAGNIYAAYTTEVGYICNSSLLDEFKELQDEQLLRFTSYIQ